jgi:hypothetical protein
MSCSATWRSSLISSFCTECMCGIWLEGERETRPHCFRSGPLAVASVTNKHVTSGGKEQGRLRNTKARSVAGHPFVCQNHEENVLVGFYVVLGKKSAEERFKFEGGTLACSTTMSSHGLSTDARPRPCFRQPIAAWIRSNPGVGPAVQLPKCLFSEGGGSTGRSPSGDALDFPPRLSS